MQKSHEEAVEDSRDVLQRAIGEPEDLTFIRLYGNIGDELIYAGTRPIAGATILQGGQRQELKWGLGAHSLGRRLPVLVRTLS